MSRDREYRVTITTVREVYEYVVTAPDADAARTEARTLAEADGWTRGAGAVEAVRL